MESSHEFAATVLFCSVVWYFIQKCLDTPLSAIPSAHFTVAYSRYWILLKKWKGQENHARFLAHKQYGPVVRTGPNEVNINFITGGVHTAFGSKFDKDKWYERTFSAEGEPYLFSMLGREQHAQRKRMLATFYTRASIRDSKHLFSVLRHTLQERFRPLLDSFAARNATVDMMHLGKSCIMDMTSGWMFGLPNSTDFLRSEAEAEYFSSTFKEWTIGWFLRGEFPYVASLMGSLGIMPALRAAEEAPKKLHAWCGRMCENADRTAPREARYGDTVLYSHFQRRLLESGSSQNPQKTVSAELFDHLAASCDVGGATFVYALWELSKRPSLETLLRQELFNVGKNGEEDFHTADNMDGLPLLEAVYRETLRLHSPNPGPWLRKVPEGGFCIPLNGSRDSIELPAGTTISASSYCLHRNPDVFHDPEKWLPERWIDAESAQRKDMDLWMWAFGSGARVCIGQHLATRVIKSILAFTITHYEISFVGEEDDMEQVDAIVAGPVGGKLLLKISRLAEP